MGRSKRKTGYLWSVLRDDRGWKGSAPTGMVFNYRPGRKGEYAEEILDCFNGTIQVDAMVACSHLATLDRTGGGPLGLAFCWAHGRRKLIKAKPKGGIPRGVGAETPQIRSSRRDRDTVNNVSPIIIITTATSTAYNMSRLPAL